MTRSKGAPLKPNDAQATVHTHRGLLHLGGGFAKHTQTPDSTIRRLA
ncbi:MULTISPECIES: hypothetical protein [Lentibacter]|nr:hypothetical protein [Lentibacter algarum]MCO4828383.1 hypothetical protein [Lentibacter algarum]